MSVVQIELWQLLVAIGSVVAAFFVVVFALGKILLSQIDKRFTEKFSAIEKDVDAWTALERDFLKFRAELPLQYVLRPDYVRNQTVIEAKLDAVASKIEMLQMRGLQK